MDQFFTKDFAGAPFQIFYLPHLSVLGLILGFNLLVAYWRGWTPERRRVFRLGLAGILIVNEIAWHLWNWSVGQWTVQTMLPLHLCSVMVFLSAALLVTRSYALYEFLYFLGIGAATQAILTPDVGAYGFPHFRFFQTFISHGGIVTAAVFMTVVEKYRPTWRSFRRVAVGANIYMLFVGGVNFLLGSNYLFIARKPDTPSLMDVLGPWPWYILSLEVVGLAICLILYLPFALKDRQTRPALGLSGEG